MDKRDASKHAPARRSRKPGPGTAVLAAALALIFLLVLLTVWRVSGLRRSGQPALPPSPSASAPAPSPSPVSSPSPEAAEAPVMLPEMELLKEQNPDLAGWIRIADTEVDYPVMFTPEDPEYYLRRNFDRKDDLAGSLFIDGHCSTEPRSANLLIHGHNMVDGSMFHTLIDYHYERFWQEHPIIEYCDLYSWKSYEIVAAFVSPVYRKSQTDVFKFYQFYDAQTAEEYDRYVSNCKAISFYDTGVEASFGDPLITLSTCDYTFVDSRLAVVARLREEPGEAASGQDGAEP